MDTNGYPPAQAAKHPRFVRWAVVLGIVVVLNVFFWVLVSIVLPMPQYADFCPQSQVVPTYNDEASCTKAGGQWTATPTDPSVQPLPAKAPTVVGYCNPDYTCGNSFAAAQASHSRNAFIALVALGVVSIIAGVFLLGSSIVSSGLSYGGVLSIIIGAISYWGDAASWIRLAISFAALVALLYIGLRRFKD